MMEEYYAFAFLGHLGARKIVNILYLCVCLLKLHATLITFCKECELWAKIKDSTIMPPGGFQLLIVANHQEA